MFTRVLEYAATHPQIPVLLGVGLYLWIALGSWMVKKPELAGMWFFYACANACMAAFYMRN